MFINKVIDDVLGISGYFLGILSFISTLIIRFHVLHKIEKRLGKKLDIAIGFKCLPNYININVVIVNYIITRFLSDRCGFKWLLYIDQITGLNHLARINYSMENFSKFDIFIAWFSLLSIICAVLISCLIF